MNELSLVRLKIQELKKELLELEMKERRLVQEEMAKQGKLVYVYSGKETLDVYLGE